MNEIFYTYSVSHLHVILSVMLWFFMLYFCHRQMQIFNNTEPNPDEEEEPFYKPRFFQVMMLVSGIVFCTFGCTGGDFLHYWELFDINAVSSMPVHYERFYYFLAQVLPHNYYLWRFCVWGVAFFFLYLIIRELDTDSDCAYCIFILFLLNHFPNLRQTLGVIVMLYGVIMLQKTRQAEMPILQGCLSLLAIALSTVFHSTMYAFIAVGMLCFIPGLKNKYTIIMALCLMPVLYMEIKDASLLMAQLLFSSNDDAMTKTVQYLDSDFRLTSNAFGLLKLFLNRAPFVIILWQGFWRVYVKDEAVSYIERYMLTFSFIFVYAAILFSGNEVSAFLSTRMWDFSLYPLSIFSMIYLRNHWDEPMVRYTLALLLISNTYNLAYEIYSIDRLNAEFAL